MQRLFTILIVFLFWTPSVVKADVQEVNVGDLIDKVIYGEKFVGKELVVSGIALNKTTPNDGLVNLGTEATYQSKSFVNFLSVYDTPVTIQEGARVKIRILIETAMATKMGDQSVVAIEAAFINCVAC